MKRLGCGLALLSLLSCVTPGPTVPPEAGDEPHQSPPGPRFERSSGSAPQNPVPLEPVWSLVSAPDTDKWPVGWVDDEEGLRFGLPARFWSEQRGNWREALRAAPAGAAFRLERIFRAAHSDEAFRAAWRLWLIDSKAGLGDQARLWLDKAAELRSDPSLGVERAWDQAFRLRDLWGARALWTELGPMPVSSKARLLRQKLFLGGRTLALAGADDYVSSLEFDRDDLWVATWNGAVVRWSLVTGDFDLIRPAGDTVSPIRCLAVTGWFIYAFQDKSLLRYSKVAGSWRSFPYPAGWNGLRVQGAVPDGQEALWVGHLGEGLWRWEKGQWTLIDAGGGGPFVDALASDGNGGLLIGTKDRGLWSWKNGVWSQVPSENGSPSNITVIEPSGDGRWAVGTWGEGAWLLDGVLRRAGAGNEYVTAAAWLASGPVWGTLDQGIYSEHRSLGPLDGAPSGVSALVTWQGRWIWGTPGQGLGWWSEDENTALSR